MYEEFFGLREKPFALVPDPDFLYLSPSHREGLNMLEYGLLGEASFIVITGEVGSGKTTLVRRFLEMVGPDVSVGLITNTHESLNSLLSWVLLSFELTFTSHDPVELYDAFARFLWMQKRNRRRTLLIIDEAQNLAPTVLEELRMLTNLNRDKELVFQIALVGQPELLNKLNQSDMRQLAQRVSADFRLAPLNFVETYGYIRFRLRTAGGNPEIFTHRACACVYLTTEGLPRLINILCDRSLVYAFGEGHTAVDIDTVLDVIEDRRSSGLSVLPALDDGTTRQVLETKVDDLLLSDPLPTSPAELRKLEDPDSEFEESEQARDNLQDTPALVEAAPEKSQVKAIPLQTPHSPPAPKKEKVEQQSAEVELEVASEEAKRGGFLGALSVAALGLTFFVIGGLFWLIASGTSLDEMAAYINDGISAYLTGEDKISSKSGSYSEGSQNLDQRTGSGPSDSNLVHGTGGAGQAGNGADTGSPTSGSSQGSEIAGAVAEASSALTTALAVRRDRGTLEPALSALFAQWDLSYSSLPGATPCKKARSRGLTCEEKSGDWNAVQEQDKPAMISLQTPEMSKPVYAVIVELDSEMATLDFGEERLRSRLSEIDAAWNGDYLLLSEPTITRKRLLGLGSKGQDVVFLRLLLSRYYEKDLGNSASFDRELEDLVKQFQDQRGLVVDGLVGAGTFKSLKLEVEARARPSLERNVALGDS